MAEKIKIGCPLCGAVLLATNEPGLEPRSITCPVCKKKSPYVNYRKLTAPADEEHTQYAGEKPAGGVSGLSGGTGSLPIGSLHLMDGSGSFPLRVGRNVVGRKAQGSSAQIQLPCPSKRMSREHLVIDVKLVPGQGYVHKVSLFKAQVNPTYIGTTKLEYGDVAVLNNGNVIRLPDMDIQFEIRDSEETELQ